MSLNYVFITEICCLVVTAVLGFYFTGGRFSLKKGIYFKKKQPKNYLVTYCYRNDTEPRQIEVTEKDHMTIKLNVMLELDSQEKRFLDLIIIDKKGI